VDCRRSGALGWSAVHLLGRGHFELRQNEPAVRLRSRHPAAPREESSFLKGARSRLGKVRREDVLTGAVLLGAFVAYLAVIQFASGALAGTDGYYHVRMARIMAAEGLVPRFPWLPLTILKEASFYDHHFLFHVALIPFTAWDPLQGAKWASVAFASLAFLAFWWLLRAHNVRWPALWSLGLLVVSEAFLYRMSMVRAQSLSLLLLAIGLHWMFTERYRRLILLGFIYVWLYNGFPLLVVVALLYAGARWLVEGTLTVKPIAYSLLGIGLGLLINPYFPRDLIFIYQHLTPKLIDATSLRVGNEWFPYETATLLRNSPLALAALAAGAVALGLNRQRMRVTTATTLLAALVFGWMLFQSRRFIEYFPPFALVFAAFAWTELPAAVGVSGAELRVGRWRLPWRRAWLEAGLLVAILLLGASFTLPAARDSLSNSASADRYAAAAAWLANNTPQGSRVFQTDWDDFTRLFYRNTHNTYLVGLDPSYLQLYDSILYDLWVEVTAGEVDNPSAVIGDVFEASYVFSDLNHRAFLRRADRDDGLVEVYRDDDAVIYRVVRD